MGMSVLVACFMRIKISLFLSLSLSLNVQLPVRVKDRVPFSIMHIGQLRFALLRRLDHVISDEKLIPNRIVATLRHVEQAVNSFFVKK